MRYLYTTICALVVCSNAYAVSLDELSGAVLEDISNTGDYYELVGECAKNEDIVKALAELQRRLPDYVIPSAHTYCKAQLNLLTKKETNYE